MRSLCGENRGWHPQQSAARLFCPDFNVWVARMLKEEPLWYTRLAELYLGPEGAEFCRFIGRTETLADDFVEIMQKLGYVWEIRRYGKRVMKLGKVHRTKKRIPEWDADLKTGVLETERKIIQRFYGENFNKRWFCKAKRSV